MPDAAIPAGYVLAGIALLLAAVLPRLLATRPFTPALVFLVAGLLAGLVPSAAPLDPMAHLVVVEHVTELCLIVALMGVGLALDRPFSWRGWASTWRLLGIGMPAFLVVASLGAWALLGVAPAVALLVAAALAPTDPVLAADVQVGEPTDDPHSEDEIRFALSSEAGLNDGLAFPFVNAALLLAAAPVGQWSTRWLAWDLVGRTVLGVACGVVLGTLFARLSFAAPAPALRFAHTADAVVVLGTVFLSYGVAEGLGGYGFLAVFAAGLAVRAHERGHEFHKALHDFVARTERVLTMALVALLGYSLGSGALAGLSWRAALLGVLLVVLVRPLASGASLWHAPLPVQDRRAIAFFGVKGMGSFYYVAFALTHAAVPDARLVWATVTFTVLVSMVLHGISATPVLRRIDRRLGRATPQVA